MTTMLNTPRYRTGRLAANRLTVRHDTRGVAWVVELHGPVHAADVHDLRDGLELAAMVHAPTVIVDLTETTFLAVAAVGELVTFGRRLHATGACGAIVVAEPMLRQMIAYLRLDAIFTIYASFDELDAAEARGWCGDRNRASALATC